jgi:hypothetical protein
MSEAVVALGQSSEGSWSEQAEFLKGQITATWLPSTELGIDGLPLMGLAWAKGKPGSPGIGCAISNLFGCRTHNRNCLSYVKSRPSCGLCDPVKPKP